MAKTKMPQVVSTSSSESTPPSPPPKKQKTSLSQKSKPKKKTKSQGVVIKEPMITRARTKRASTPGSSIGKGKEVVRTPTPSQSSSDTPTFVGKSPPETKYDRKIAKVMASMLDEAYKSHEGKQGSSKTPRTPLKQGTEEREEEVTIPPKGFNKGKLVETPKYKVDFSRKKVCKMFYIDLSILKEALKFDLSPYLNSYMPWLSIRLPYCTKIVRHFYSNLEYVDDPIRNEVEEEMTTQVRGQTILISPSRINNWLGIEDPPDGFIPNLEPNQIFSVLRPHERVGPLIFNPSDMCDLHRVL